MKVVNYKIKNLGELIKLINWLQYNWFAWVDTKCEEQEDNSYHYTVVYKADQSHFTV